VTFTEFQVTLVQKVVLWGEEGKHFQCTIVAFLLQLINYNKGFAKQIGNNIVVIYCFPFDFRLHPTKYMC